MVARRAIFHAQELYVVSNDNGERQVFLLEFLGINIQEHLVQTLNATLQQGRSLLRGFNKQIIFLLKIKLIIHSLRIGYQISLIFGEQNVAFVLNGVTLDRKSTRLNSSHANIS